MEDGIVMIIKQEIKAGIIMGMITIIITLPMEIITKVIIGLMEMGIMRGTKLVTLLGTTVREVLGRIMVIEVSQADKAMDVNVLTGQLCKLMEVNVFM